MSGLHGPLALEVRPLPREVRRHGQARRYLKPTLNALAPTKRPGVQTPTRVANPYSDAKAATISAALAECSFTRIATRP